MPSSLLEASSDLMVISVNWCVVTFSKYKSIHISKHDLGETTDEKAYRTVNPLLSDESNSTCNLGFRSKLRFVKETLANDVCVES
uniref:Uncharacterized protein n=1 Tax=Arundo donax TaxID=35708 RepID=A0A0A9EX56_ARUDO